MLYEYPLSTPRENFYNITPQVREVVSKSGVTDGIAVVYCPHTTAGQGEGHLYGGVSREILYFLDVHYAVFNLGYSVPRCQ